MYIRRKIHAQISSHIARKEYTIITGARQSGKTSLLSALYNEIRKEKEVAIYITFEDPDVLTAINGHPEEIFSFIPRPVKYVDGSNPGGQPYYLFIDEIQYAEKPSNFLKYLYDTYGENLKVIATGSSAFYIDKKFRDSLAGRKRIFELKTLDFEEWLLFRDQENLMRDLTWIREKKDYHSLMHKELMEKFNEFLIYGGYPEVVLEKDMDEKKNLLKDIKNSFIKRDIDESGISDPQKFYTLLTLLSGQTGNLVNKNELAATIGVDNKTLDKYLYVLQNCFHIILLKPFYSNLRKELTKMPKVFFSDLGLRNMALNRFFDFDQREDSGALLENYVYNRLTGIYDADMIYFWRTTDNKEIDFIINTSYRRGLAYEVKMQCRPVKLTTRRKFINAYPGFPVEVISYEMKKPCKWVMAL